jgi:formiminotetrahydrofolate cyclodeaminase
MLDQSVVRLLDAVSARTPTPGGGAVVGLTGALACALARMVAEYSRGRKVDEAVVERVGGWIEQLRAAEGMLRQLVSEDAAAYDQVMKASAKSRGAQPPDEDRVFAYRTALAVPLQTAAVAAGVLACMDEMASFANRSMLSDLAVAALLAETVAKASQYFVLANARELPSPDDRRRAASEIDEIVSHAATRTASILRHVQEHEQHQARRDNRS